MIEGLTDMLCTKSTLMGRKGKVPQVVCNHNMAHTLKGKFEVSCLISIKLYRMLNTASYLESEGSRDAHHVMDVPTIEDKMTENRLCNAPLRTVEQQRKEHIAQGRERE